MRNGWVERRKGKKEGRENSLEETLVLSTFRGYWVGDLDSHGSPQNNAFSKANGRKHYVSCHFQVSRGCLCGTSQVACFVRHPVLQLSYSFSCLPPQTSPAWSGWCSHVAGAFAVSRYLLSASLTLSTSLCTSAWRQSIPEYFAELHYSAHILHVFSACISKSHL